MQKTLKKQQNRQNKTSKNKEKEKRRIQRKLSNNNKQFWVTFYIKRYILLENIVLKKSNLCHRILYTVFMHLSISEMQY